MSESPLNLLKKLTVIQEGLIGLASELRQAPNSLKASSSCSLRNYNDNPSISQALSVMDRDENSVEWYTSFHYDGKDWVFTLDVSALHSEWRESKQVASIYSLVTNDLEEVIQILSKCPKAIRESFESRKFTQWFEVIDE